MTSGSADVEKNGDKLHRARLDRSDRLSFALCLIEPRPRQHLLALLGLTEVHAGVEDIEATRSNLDQWRHEADRLELQGKEEQAAEIREQILKQRQVPWRVLRGDALTQLEEKAWEGQEKQARVALLENALVYRDQRRLNAPVQAGFKTARQPDTAMSVLEKKHFEHYGFKNPAGVLRETDKYGVDFRDIVDQTPLPIASRMGNADLAEALLDIVPLCARLCQPVQMRGFDHGGHEFSDHRNDFGPGRGVFGHRARIPLADRVVGRRADPGRAIHGLSRLQPRPLGRHHQPALLGS
jgi:hypothetical protein